MLVTVAEQTYRVCRQATDCRTKQQNMVTKCSVLQRAYVIQHHGEF